MEKTLINLAQGAVAHLASGGKVKGYVAVMPRYEVYGKVALGQTVRVVDGDEEYRGVVCWVHPARRYFQLDVGGYRESFHFPAEEGEER